MCRLNQPFIKLFASFAGAIVLTSCATQPPVNFAWWVKLEIEPRGESYVTVPVTSLDPSIKKLSLLTCDAPEPTFTLEQCSDVATNGARFEVEGDFNGDDKNDIARAGVAEKHDGTLISVLLIGPAHEPTGHQVLTVPGNGFSALHIQSGLWWYFCMLCDNGGRVVWNPIQRMYEIDWGNEEESGA